MVKKTKAVNVLEKFEQSSSRHSGMQARITRNIIKKSDFNIKIS
jgi:hypothetical protein